jgi:glycosyltransferase involved in cell wall biosynthesis
VGTGPIVDGPLHVALCTDGVFPFALGGMQRHSRLLAEHLARSGKVRLTVLHPHDRQVFDPALGITEERIAPMDEEAFYLRQLWLYSDRVAAALYRVRSDVVLSQGFSVWKDIDRFSKRLAVHPHGLEMFQGITVRDKLVGLPFRWAMRDILRRSARAISLGGGLTPMMEQLVKGSPAEVVVLPNAVEVPVLDTPYPEDEGPLRLLFVGRFAFNKGIDVLMDVSRRLQGEGQEGVVRFLLAGEGPLLAHYRDKGPPSNVEFLGRLDDEALFRQYDQCHALVLPTRFEGMPTVVLEAMARSRPVLVSDVGATAELVDTTNGWLLPKGDADALYTAIREFVALPAERRRALGVAGHQRALERFTWEAVTTGTVRVLQELARS